MLGLILTVLYIVSCFVLIMFVLLQPGKSDASQVFGGGVNSAAFGPRGTQTVLAKITITAAVCFFLIAFLFSIPGLFEKRSLGEGVGPAEAAPVSPAAPAEQAPTVPPNAAAPSTQPAAAPSKPAGENANKQAKPGGSKDAAKPGTDKEN
ncbi:MAG: preprotein translocase subunit SecG [Acidobacteriota bacterium]